MTHHNIFRGKNLFNLSHLLISSHLMNHCFDFFKVTIVNDGTKSNEDRLGAVADIRFAVEAQNFRCSDVLIIAGTVFMQCTKSNRVVYPLEDYSMLSDVVNFRRHVVLPRLFTWTVCPRVQESPADLFRCKSDRPLPLSR